MSNRLGIREKAHCGKPLPAIRKCSWLSPDKHRKSYWAALLTVLGTSAVLAIAAGAENKLLHGHVTFTESSGGADKTSAATKPKPASGQPQQRKSDLLAKYGTAAISPNVAAAIRKAEAMQSAPGSERAADQYEALARGRWTPGADPMLAIMYGYVPPNMDPATAALLSRSLPKLPRMPGPITPEQIARMAGEPTDPLATSLPQGLTRADVEAANQQMLSSYMRERFGPVYVPPLHRSPLATGSAKLAKDNQGSIREMVDANGNIVAQYDYTPYGERTKIAGTGPDADFGFHGMYHHARSGLYLTPFRPHSPTLGRFITRDPMGEAGGTNLFAFAGNDPVNNRDPLGLTPFPWRTS